MARVIVSDSTNRIELNIFSSDWKFIENTKVESIVDIKAIPVHCVYSCDSKLALKCVNTN